MIEFAMELGNGRRLVYAIRAEPLVTIVPWQTWRRICRALGRE